MSVKFPTDLIDRGTVKITDNLLIHNIDTGVTEYTTVAKLLTALGLLTGNVGINTIVPLAKFQINGTLSNPALATDNGIFRVYGPTVHSTLDFGAITGVPWSIWIQSKDDATDTAQPISINPLGGNVGIGTTAPKAKLDVVGLTPHANNAAALLAGLQVGSFYYETGSDPAHLCVVV